jgi:hypothetical protein
MERLQPFRKLLNISFRLLRLRVNSQERARSVRARLQSCLKWQKINGGFSP